MRTAFMFLLLASAAAPAFASPDDDRRDRRAERAERTERAEKSDDRPQRVEPAQREERAEERREAIRQQSAERRALTGADTPRSVADSDDAPESVRNWRRRDRFRDSSPGVIHERNRADRQTRQSNVDRYAPAVSRVPMEGTQPPARSGARTLHKAMQRWSDSWRSDRRYDWRNHRRRYSWLYNFGFYNDPFGWGYRPFSIGWRMWPSYYSRSYWLNDPWQYRLPYAPPGYRWIRYYDDAILVDTWDGQVVDVIRNFFW